MKKWQPLFLTPADCALPFFFPSVLHGMKNVTVHVIYQVFFLFCGAFFLHPFFSYLFKLLIGPFQLSSRVLRVIFSCVYKCNEIFVMYETVV